MKDKDWNNPTGCFFTALLIVVFTAVGVKVVNHFYITPAQLIIDNMITEHEKRVEVMRKRLQYAKTCVLEEKVLDHQFGPMQYNCERIAEQVYPFPDELKKI